MELNCRFVRNWINNELPLAPEVVDNELDQENEKGPQHNSQCDLYYHADLARPVMLYLGSAAGAGFISRKNLKNSAFVERISVSFWVNVSLYVSIVLLKL